MSEPVSIVGFYGMAPILRERKLRQKTREYIDYHRALVCPGFDVAAWASTLPGRVIFASVRALNPQYSEATVACGSGEFAAAS